MVDKARLKRRQLEREAQFIAEQLIHIELFGFMIEQIKDGIENVDKETVRLAIRAEWIKPEKKLGKPIPELIMRAESVEEAMRFGGAGWVAKRETFFEDKHE